MSSPVSVEESLTSQIRMTSSKGYALRPLYRAGHSLGPALQVSLRDKHLVESCAGGQGPERPPVPRRLSDLE
jgi:hypothetical protein